MSLRSWQVRVALLAVLAAAAGLLGALSVGGALSAGRAATRPAPVSRVPFGVRLAAGEVTGDRSAVARYLRDRSLQVRRLLRARALAVVHRDEAAFLATDDPAEHRFLATQRVQFTDLLQIPFASWGYRVDEADAIPPQTVGWQRYGTDVFAPPLTLRYQIRGFDPAPVAHVVLYTFVLRAGRWLVGSDTDGSVLSVPTRDDPWDFGPVVVARGASSLVIGSRRDAATLALVARAADTAVGHVTGVWGTAWPRRVVVVVARDQEFADQLRGGYRQDKEIAAIEVPQWSDAAAFDAALTAAPRPVSARVIVNPAGFDPVDPENVVLLTHEITHVATVRASSPVMPRWMLEGFAEYVGLSTTGYVERADASLLADLRAGRPPQMLPNETDFDAAPDLARQYQESWLACRLVAQRWGVGTLVALYRRLGQVDSLDDQPQQTDAAMRAVLGVGLATFVADWQRYLLEVVPTLQ